MRDLTQQALRYAALNWRIVPLHTPVGDKCDCGRPDCGSIGKHPRIKDWTNTASCDEATVREWWGRWPAANIGIATGPETGIVVLDVDPRHGGFDSLTELTDEHGLMPHGPISATGGGGWHFFLKHPGRKILSHTIRPGLDVKGDGGMVVAPSSAHATGILYEWTIDCGPDEPIPDIPGWLDALMSQAAPTGLQRPPVTDVLASGDRNQGLFRLGSGMRSKGFSEPAIYAALLAENNERCIPPLAQTEVAIIAASAARYEVTEGIPILGTGQAPAKKERSRHIEPRTARLSDIQHKVYPPPKYAISGLIPMGLCLCAGQLKSGKSWLALGIGLAIAEGGISLGEFPCDTGDVLYIAYEDPERRLHVRTKALIGDGLWPARFEFAEQGAWPTRNDGGLEAIDSWLGSRPGARLVIIDTLQRFRAADVMEGDRNAYAADYNVSGELQELALKHEVAFLVIHHFRKMMIAEDDWVNRVSGSNGIAGAADVIMGFTAVRGATRTATLRVTGRDIEEADYALAWDEKQYGWYITGTAEDAEMSAEAKTFTKALWDIGHGEGVHYKAIAEELGIHAPTAQKMGRRLADKGFVLSVARGMYKPVRAVRNTVIGQATDTDSTDYFGQGGLSEIVRAVRNTDTLSKAPDKLRTVRTISDRGPVRSFESEDGGGPDTNGQSDSKIEFSTGPGYACPDCTTTDRWLPRITGGWVCGSCHKWETPT